MLPKELLRVSRAGGNYRPRFVDDEAGPLAQRVLDAYRTHVDATRAELERSLSAIEAESDDFKLVRGFAKLLEREADFRPRSSLDPEAARRAVFSAAESIPVVSDAERTRAIEQAAGRLDAPPADVERSLYADLEDRHVLIDAGATWSAGELIERYNRSLAQTAMFDATSVRIKSSDPKALVVAVKRLGLLYTVRRSASGRSLEVTGPDALFRHTRRYGTAFARLLGTVGAADRWEIEATIDDRGSSRTMRLTQSDPVGAIDDDGAPSPVYDSAVEAEFATRFSALDLDWSLEREPEPLETGARVMIPDFAFDYQYAPFRVFFEIMGYWTPEYVANKLDQFADLEDVDMVVAVNERLGVGESVEAMDHRVIRYRDRVRIKDVATVLREYERTLEADAVDRLPTELIPEADVLSLADLAGRHGVSERVLASTSFPEHERVGRTLVRPAILDRLADRLEAGTSYESADELVRAAGFDDPSALFSRLGFRVVWNGLVPDRIERVEPAETVD